MLRLLLGALALGGALLGAAPPVSASDPLLYAPGPPPPGLAPGGGLADDAHAAEVGRALAQADNGALARLYTRLHFDLERGAARAASARWATPVAIEVDPRLAPYRPFLERLSAALRNRAEAPVFLAARDRGATSSGGGGRLHIRVAPTIDMRRHLGQSVCIAAPGDWRWAELTASFRADTPPRWDRVTDIDAATIFVPDRAPPWLMRTCFQEEVLQSLGPAGDVFWLTETIFNDDNVRLSPTALDFLMVRVAFAPELTAGLSRAETAAAAEAALDRIRPEGRRAGGARRAGAWTLYPPAPEWRAKLMLARTVRHPVFAPKFFADAVAAAQGLAPSDPRRLWTEFEAARDLARARPLSAGRRLDAIAVRFEARHGPDSPYTALVRLAQAEARLAAGAFDDGAALAAAAERTFRSEGREDAVLTALKLRAAAEAGARRVADAPAATGILADEIAAWTAYAHGVRARRFEIRDAPPPPPQGYAPITLAALLTFGPLLALFWALRRLF